MKKIELYSRESLERLKKQNRIWKILLFSFSAVALIVEIILCVLLNTENESRMIYWLVGVSAVAGWIVIYFSVFRLGKGRIEARHAENMLSGEREELAGRLKLTDEVLRIKKSITLRKAELYDEERMHRVNVHVDKAALLPEGNVRIWTVSNYIVAFEAGEGYEPSGKGPKKKRLKVLRNIISQLHSFTVWALVSVIIWGWVFTHLTDTVPARKVEIFVNAYDVRYNELRLELEKDLPDGIKLVKVHLFDDAMFSGDTLLNADIYIVRASEVESLLESFAGEGIKVYDAASGKGAADEYILYHVQGAADEDYYLFYGVNSLHTGEKDEAAFRVAERFLSLGKE